MLVYLNLNKKYPQNNNICITDFARDKIKIYDGNNFIYDKYENVKDKILTNVIKNTRKIINKYENNDNIKKCKNTINKLKINDVSLKLIDDYTGEQIVTEEIIKQENFNKLIKNENSEEKNIRDFTFDERMRIKNLDNKKNGLQKKVFENMKIDLYNSRNNIITNNNF
jgi:hypothetical protein